MATHTPLIRTLERLVSETFGFMTSSVGPNLPRFVNEVVSFIGPVSSWIQNNPSAIIAVIVLFVTWLAYHITKAKTTLEDFDISQKASESPPFRFQIKNMSHTTPLVVRGRLHYRMGNSDTWTPLSNERYRAPEVQQCVIHGADTGPKKIENQPLYPQLPGTSRGYLPWRARIEPRDFRILGSTPFNDHRQQAQSILSQAHDIANNQDHFQNVNWDGRTIELHPVSDDATSYTISLDDYFPDLEIPSEATDLRFVIEQTREIYRFERDSHGEWYYLGKAYGTTPDDVLSNPVNVQKATFRNPPRLSGLYSFLTGTYKRTYNLCWYRLRKTAKQVLQRF